MRRREFIGIAGGAAVWPLAGRAQKATPVMGYLSSGDAATGASLGFHQGLEKAGYIEGQNLAIEYRWAEGHYHRLPALAADLIGRNVEVIATIGMPAALAAKSATSTIPIVFNVGTDPVAEGLVASLARPGGNLTGVTVISTELMPKRLELLSELLPRAAVFALLVHPKNASAEPQSRNLQEAARAKQAELHILQAGTETEIENAFARLAQLHVDALVVGSDVFFFSQSERLVALAARYAIPAIYELSVFTTAGGLISYGPSLNSLSEHAGIYVGKILKGIKPADLPVEQPTKFELVINLKTAKQLGLTIPQSILARADEVIE